MKAFTRCFWPSQNEVDGDVHDGPMHQISSPTSPTRRSQERMRQGSTTYSGSAKRKHSMGQESGSSAQTHWTSTSATGPSEVMKVTFCRAQQLMDVADLRWLGEGSQGVVYEGVWHGGSVVAVKFSLFKERKISAAWLCSELMFSRSLSHPNVVQTYDAKASILDAKMCTEEPHTGEPAPLSGDKITRTDSYHSDEGFGDPFRKHNGPNDVRDMLRMMGAQPGQYLTQLVMEYCDQGSLLNAIQQGIFQQSSKFGPKIALRALYRTAREVAQGMVHLHQGNVLHGDLKPANVLLTSSRKDKRGFVAKVSDFGLAHYLDSSSEAVEEAPWGTLVFMAPERFQQRLLAHGSDVWSFGVMMWQMYTARIPYQGSNATQLAQGITSGTLKLKWPAGSPECLMSLVRECMAFSPAERPTFTALVQELTALENNLRMEGMRLSTEANNDQAASDGTAGSSSQHRAQRRVCRMSSVPDGNPTPAVQEEAVSYAAQGASQGVWLQKTKSQPHPAHHNRSAAAITDLMLQPDGSESPNAAALRFTTPDSPAQGDSTGLTDACSPPAKREQVSMMAAGLRASFTKHAAQSSSMDTSFASGMAMSMSTGQSKAASAGSQSGNEDVSPGRQGAAPGMPTGNWGAALAGIVEQEQTKCIFKNSNVSTTRSRVGNVSIGRVGSGAQNEASLSRLRTSSSVDMAQP